MKNYKKLLIISGTLVFLYTFSLTLGGYLGAIQYPFLIYLIFGGIDSVEIRKEDVLLSIFSDYINDLYFGSSFIIFGILRFLYLKYSNFFPNDMFSLFIGKSVSLLIFLAAISFLLVFNIDVKMTLIFFLVNMIFLFVLLIGKQKVKLQ